jgi:hypothetical protein
MSDLTRLLMVAALSLVACESTGTPSTARPVLGPWAVVRASTTPTTPSELMRVREGAARPASVPLDHHVCSLRHRTC